MSEKDEEILLEARERLKVAQDHDNENHKRAVESLKFKVGDQWNEVAKREREASSRPMLTINKMPQYIRQVVNEFRQSRPGIRVRPVDSGDDKETAEVLNGLIRHIENQSQAESIYDYGCEQAVDGGFGYWRVITDYTDDTAFDQEIFIKRIKNRFTVFLDPMADEPDRSDIRWAFVTEMIPKEEFKRKYPKANTDGWEATQTHDDWFTSDAVRVAEYWTCEPVKKTLVLLSNGQTIEIPKGKEKEEYLAELTERVYAETGEIIEEQNSRVAMTKKVTQYLLTAGEVLEKNDWAGKYIPIVMVVGDETNVDGKDFINGLIHHAKDAQSMYNYHRTASVEHIAQATKAPWLLTTEQVDGHESMWRNANTANYPYLLYNPDNKAGKPDRIGMPTTPTGLVNEAMIASDDMQGTIGIYDPSIGKRSNETSGVAIAQREQQADTGTFHYLDNMNRAIAYTGRILVDLIPRIYDTARQVRILGIDSKEKFVPINQEYIDPETGEKKLHDLAAGRYDVYVEAGQSYATKREETKQLLLDVMNSAGQYVPVLLPLLLKNIDMEGAEDAMEKIQEMNEAMGLGGKPGPGMPNNQPIPPMGGQPPAGFPL